MVLLSSLLCEAGRLAAEVHKKHLQQGFQVEQKSELESDVVTAADKETEHVLRDFFAQHLPDYNIFGEEFGAEYDGNGKIIVIDPLDGTLSFTKRFPGFGTVIGVYEEKSNGTTNAAEEDKREEKGKVHCVAGYVSNTMKGISYFGSLEEGFHRHGLEEIIPKKAIYVGGAFSRNQQIADILQRLLEEEFPNHPLVMHTQQVTSRCRVYEGSWAVSLHSALAWHDIAPDPLFGQLTGCRVTDLNGNPYEMFDAEQELKNYESNERQQVYSKPILVCQPKYFDGILKVLERLEKETGRREGKWS